MDQSKEAGETGIGKLSGRGETKGNKLSNNHRDTFGVRRGCPVSQNIPDTEID